MHIQLNQSLVELIVNTVYILDHSRDIAQQIAIIASFNATITSYNPLKLNNSIINTLTFLYII